MIINAVVTFCFLLAGAGSHEKGDDLFARMQYQPALNAYDAALASGADSARILWRLARASICLADVSPKAAADSLYQTAEQYARSSVRLDSTIPQGHTWLAAALGNIAMNEGSAGKVRLCREIKANLDFALRLDSTDDVALSILGSFYLALGDVSWFERRLAGIFLGGLPPGGYEDAEHALLRAEALSPRTIRNHEELGNLYMKMKRSADALAEFGKVLELPISIASDRAAKARAAKFIQQIEENE